MSEINISDISQPAADNAPYVKNKKPKRSPLVIAALVIIPIAVFSVVNRIIWNRYNEKYYLYFINKNNIDTSCIESASSWGYVPYSYKGSPITLTFHKPQKGKYTFGATLASGYNDHVGYWEVPFNEYEYEYELWCGIGPFGKKEYFMDFNTYEHFSNMSYEVFGMQITEDGRFIYDSDGFTELTDENRQVIAYLRDDILDLKAELDKIME